MCRRFLEKGCSWSSVSTRLSQQRKERTVRVRTIGDKGFLTVKGLTVGCTRLEFEYEIPYSDAEKMLDELAEKPIIEKLRYVIPSDNGLKWED